MIATLASTFGRRLLIGVAAALAAAVARRIVDKALPHSQAQPAA